MYKNNSLLNVAIKVSVYMIICFFGNGVLAKGISLKAHQLAHTKEVDITVVCLGKRQITSSYPTADRPLTTKEEYDIEMISFEAKGKFTGFTFTGKAEVYSDEKVKKKLLSKYDVTLSIDAKTGALKRLEFDGICDESRGDKYSTWDILIEGPIPASESYYNHDLLDYVDNEDAIYRIKKFHGSLDTVVTKDYLGKTDSTYKWTFDHIAKKISDLNLSKPNRKLSNDSWFSVSVDVNAEPKVEIEVVQPFTLPQKEKSIIPGNITAKCETLGSAFNSYRVLFYAKSPLGHIVDNTSSLLSSNLVIDDFEKAGFAQKDWLPILHELKISQRDIIKLGVFNHDGTYTYNYFRHPGILIDIVGDQLKKTAPLDITVGVAMIGVMDKKLKSSATAKLSFPGIVRLDEVALHGTKEEIREMTEKVNVFRKGLGTIAVFGKGIKNRPSRSRQVPVYLNSDDVVNLDRNDMVKMTCPTGLRLSIMSKRHVVGKDQTAKFIIGATRGQHGYQHESDKLRNYQREIGITLSGAGIVVYSNPYISVPIAIIAIGVGLLSDVPFVVSEIQSTILAEFDEKGIDFYTIEGTNLLRTAKGDVSKVTTGHKSVFTSDGRITRAEKFDKSQLKPEALELLEFHQKPDEVTSNETVMANAKLGETAEEAPPLSSLPKETSQSNNTVMTETKTTATEPAVVDDVTKGKYEKVFYDDFNEENKGKGKLNYRGLEQWYVTYGEIDLIGNGLWDIQPENGLYVDLDGTVNKAGTIQTRMAYSLPPGKYRLQFDIAGHQWSTNTVVVSVGNVYRETFTLNPKEPFRTIRRDISVKHFIQARIRFEHKGGDNAGILLDNVRLDQEI